ncbi:DUF523 domain-containing protein [Chitinivorax sp. PXF-14]|uniref:DUF523 domain-containing protein n=1 Tax=Chitinivorax sp. PXF-14 TaxID=3230488 RepID=UPI0034661BF8
MAGTDPSDSNPAPGMGAPGKILVSACLLGANVRYNAIPCGAVAPILAQWLGEGRVVPVCPEVAGGLPTPRPAAEISGGDGRRVWLGQARVMTTAGDDVSRAFQAGAQAALALVRSHGIRIAVLKARSPSCGNAQIYDGSFSATRIDGMGVTAALLAEHGVAVFNEDELEQADALLRRLERG